jgi:hypothetical protein
VKTAEAVAAVEAAAPTVWGGDWNHALSGQESTGSQEGRRHILDVVDRLGLQVPTATCPHRIEGLLSIDHIAIPAEWTVVGVEHFSACYDGVRISDHDAYVIDVRPLTAPFRRGRLPQRTEPPVSIGAGIDTSLDAGDTAPPLRRPGPGSLLKDWVNRRSPTTGVG